jgi:DNA mismatch repair protein MutS
MVNNNKNDETSTEEYLNFHNKYCKIYGDEKTLVLYEVGTFYETYATETEGPDLLQISKLTNVVRTRKNKKIKDIGINNPYVLGIPTVAFIKYLEILIENNYIVIIVDQDNSVETKKGERMKRNVTNIYSKGTYIDNLQRKDGNYIACLYISNDDQKNSTTSLFSIGVTGVDVSTGNVYIHEAYSTKYDSSYAFDETERFLTNIDPKEILIFYQDNTKLNKTDKNKSKRDKEYIFNYLKLNDEICRYKNTIDTKYTKLVFQNEILKKVYPDAKSFVSPIEQLNLDKSIYAIVSLVMAFDFIYDKNTNLLNNLSKPIFFINKKHLTLGNNAVRQLDILENVNNNTKCKFRSLFHVINKTSTALGERFLKSRILSPLIDNDNLNTIYDLTENIIKNNTYVTIEKFLDNIKDIERLQRKIELKIIRPFEMSFFMSSYENIYDLIQIIKTETKHKKLKTIIPKDKIHDEIKKMLDYINHVFDMDEMEKYSTMEIKTSIFNDGIYKDIDDVKENVNLAHKIMEQLRDSLDGLIKTASKNCISINKDKNGYYLKLTNIRAEILKEKLNKLKIIKIGEKKLEASCLDFKKFTKDTKIYVPSLGQKSDDIETYNDELQELNEKYFIQEMGIIYSKFSKLFAECNNFVANIDFIKSSAKLAIEYGYSKPKIVENDFGYVCATKMRHPIIERLIDYEYVPHDVELGDSLKGMMLYGLNSAGKSSMMKAIGLNIIMAQSGLFVPAETFKFTPYQSLYTRITGDDNIFRGLSSFSLEMVEINAILKRADEFTLVIGDEVCRGTEHISGNAIVATTIMKLAEAKSSFIFATHLHEIMTLNEIKKIETVKAFHLYISYDEKTKSLIYDRKLKEGSGEQIYGITVARYIIQDTDFIDTAMRIKNELLESHDSMISGKTSKYNSNVLVYECHLCGKKDKNAHLSNLETHHINFQKDCDGNFVKNKKHLKKNQEANLIVLCGECHDKIHDGKIKLNGYTMTSNGKNIIINN